MITITLTEPEAATLIVALLRHTVTAEAIERGSVSFPIATVRAALQLTPAGVEVLRHRIGDASGLASGGVL